MQRCFELTGLLLRLKVSISAPSAGFVCTKPRGAVAQLGERLVRNEEASGSIPLSSTIFLIKSTILYNGTEAKIQPEKL